MTTDPKTLVLYHGDCIDGFCAAWQCWRVMPDAEFRAVRYGEPAPIADAAGREVLIVDFCYPADETRRLWAASKSLHVLDHHKTAEADARELLRDLTGMATFAMTFDMDRSGAGLARDLIVADHRPDLAQSWIVDYVQDRDLWRFELPDSRAVNAYLHTLDFSFVEFEAADNALTAKEAAELGRGAEAYKQMYVERMSKHARHVPFGGLPGVPIVNAPYVAINELVNELAKTSPPFAVGWFQRGDGKIVFSLRSIGTFDASAVAKRFGGGGHKNAAGFTLPFHEALKLIEWGDTP